MTPSGSTWRQTPPAARALWVAGVLAIAVGWLLDWFDTWEAVAGLVGPLGILAILAGLAIDLTKRPRTRR